MGSPGPFAAPRIDARPPFRETEPAAELHLALSLTPDTGVERSHGWRRVLDVVIAAVSLVALAPLLLVVALLVKTSKGPVFYRQTRVGLERRTSERRADPIHAGLRDRRRNDRRLAQAHGYPFRIVKFRTMVADAEASGPRWSTQNDPRITPVGRLLRATRLDETPQFWNVLCGDMSIVGPRPERPFFVDQFVERIPRYRERLRVRPGITGQAQVTLAYDSSIDDVVRKLEQDLLYIEQRSMARDLSILVRTVGVVLTGRGAR